MAGGSTDAAATLKGMNRLFDLGCTLKDLMDLGVKIGADVPYCVMGGTALAEGIGEKLTPLAPAPDCYVLVAKPDINVSTKYAVSYTHLDVYKRQRMRWICWPMPWYLSPAPCRYRLSAR